MTSVKEGVYIRESIFGILDCREASTTSHKKRLKEACIDKSVGEMSYKENI